MDGDRIAMVCSDDNLTGRKRVERPSGIENFREENKYSNTETTAVFTLTVSF